VEPWKGQDIAVRMLADLAIADARLVLIGERYSPTWPDFGPYLQGLARDLEVADRVLFTGHRGDARALLPALDVLVCASREEGFGLAIIEAMAAGVPVVATRCGGPQDILEHQRTGLLAAPDDPAELARAVRVVLHHPDMATAIAKRAHLAWRERFTGQRSAAAFASALSEWPA
jgi:glycosyltransferase involved in cell wall biosynthesis